MWTCTTVCTGPPCWSSLTSTRPSLGSLSQRFWKSTEDFVQVTDCNKIGFHGKDILPGILSQEALHHSMPVCLFLRPYCPFLDFTKNVLNDWLHPIVLLMLELNYWVIMNVSTKYFFILAREWGYFMQPKIQTLDRIVGIHGHFCTRAFLSFGIGVSSDLLL